jgi:hypothetical protein
VVALEPFLTRSDDLTNDQSAHANDGSSEDVTVEDDTVEDDKGNMSEPSPMGT